MGFRCLDCFCERVGVDFDRERFKGSCHVEKEASHGGSYILFKPLTFMNLSGTAVREIVSYFKIDLDDILVIYDDMDLLPGDFRLRAKGSSGGHKGMQSIIDCLGSSNIKRIKIGIGKPEFASVVDYVLGRPSKEEEPSIEEATHGAAEAIVHFLSHPFDETMSRFNRPRERTR